MSPLSYLKPAKDVAAALGIGGIMLSAYTVSGLPMPATVYQLDQRVKPIELSVRAITLDSVETQRSLLALRRTFLRNEEYTLQKAIESGDAQTKITLTRRLGEIDDELVDISKRDDALVAHAAELKRS
jgi:hypothetical protein